MDGRYLIHSIHKLAESDDNLSILKKLLDKEPSQLNIRNKKGLTPLMISSYCGSIGICNELISRGVDLDIKRKDGFTPMLIAAMRGTEKNIDLLLLLARNKANVNITGPMGMSVLHFLTTKNYESAIIELIDVYKANVNIKTTEKSTPLHMACKASNLRLAKILIEKGADKNIKNNNSKTPLELIDNLIDRNTLL